MKKISFSFIITLISLFGLALILSGCLKFTPQAEFEAEQREKQNAASGTQGGLSLEVESNQVKNEVNVKGDDDQNKTEVQIKAEDGQNKAKVQVKTDEQIQAEIEGSLKTIKEGQNDVPQNPTGGEPTPLP